MLWINLFFKENLASEHNLMQGFVLKWETDSFLTFWREVFQYHEI